MTKVILQQSLDPGLAMTVVGRHATQDVVEEGLYPPCHGVYRRCPRCFSKCRLRLRS